jgi:hypothetical protein
LAEDIIKNRGPQLSTVTLKKWAAERHIRLQTWLTDPCEISVEELLHLPFTPTGQLLRNACFPPLTQSEQADNEWGDARFSARVLEGINVFLEESDGTFNHPPSHHYNSLN